MPVETVRGTLVVDLGRCLGCRSCEMACSFHHVGAFAPSISSLSILDKEDGAGFRVLLLEEADGLGRACDSCDGLQVPLCVEYCRESEAQSPRVRYSQADTAT